MSQPDSKLNASIEALLLDAVFRSAIDGIIVIDAKGTMEMVNQAAADLFQYSIEEMIGQNVRLIVPAPHKAQHDGYLQRYLQTGEKKIIGIGREVPGLRKDGSQFPLRLSISELELNGKRKFTGIVHDLSAQKDAQQAMEWEKEKAQMYFDLASTYNLILDQEGKILQANKKVLEFTGLTEEELIGRLWMDTFIPDPLPHPEFELTAMINGDLAFAPYFEAAAIDKKGAEYFFSWYASVLYEKDKSLAGCIVSGTDISQRKRMEIELEERVDQRTEELANAVNQLLTNNQKLEFEVQERKAAVEALSKKEEELRKAYEKEMELNQLKSRFVSMASHEFRTPLATIQSSADLVEAYEKPEQQPQRLKHTGRIRSAVSHLNNMLNDLLSLSRLEEGKIQIEKSTFSLKAFCDDLMGEIDGLLKKDQQILHEHPIQDQQIFTDKKFLKNILLNLISNAIKYSDEGSTILCDIQLTDQDGLALKVKDEGIGIPEEDKGHLFNRFFRAQNVENIKGTGLGLHIVKQYLDLLHGEISYESTEGKGTTFYVSIPLDSSMDT